MSYGQWRGNPQEIHLLHHRGLFELGGISLARVAGRKYELFSMKPQWRSAWDLPQSHFCFLCSRKQTKALAKHPSNCNMDDKFFALVGLTWFGPLSKMSFYSWICGGPQQSPLEILLGGSLALLARSRLAEWKLTALSQTHGCSTLGIDTVLQLGIYQLNWVANIKTRQD